MGVPRGGGVEANCARITALQGQIYFCFRVEYLTPVGRELEKLLKIPINNFNDILTVLRLSHFAPLIQLFDFDGRKALAVFIAENVLENETLIPTSEQVDTILGLLAPLISDQVFTSESSFKEN